MAQQFAEYQDKLNEFIKKGDVEWEAFLDWWRIKNAEPVEHEVTKRNVDLNIKFWLALVSACGALALSGFRVAERFYTVAGGAISTTNPWFSIGEAISGVLAVNVTIFAMAVAHAYTTKKTDETSQIAGLVTAIAISSIAGLGQAAKWLGTDWASLVSGLDLVLVILLGVGASALEYFSGDLLGVEIVRYVNDKLSSEHEYEQKVFTNRSQFEREHKEWLKNAKGQFGLFISNFKVFTKQNSEQAHAQGERGVNDDEPEPETVNVKNIVVNGQLVHNILSEHYERTGELLGVMDCSRKLATFILKIREHSQTDYEKKLVQAFVHSKKGKISELRKEFAEQLNIFSEQ
jgi:hypothetical protein